MKTKQRIDLPLKIKAVNEKGEFSGYASVFGNKDCDGDIVVKGAFEKSLARWRERGLFPSLLWQHQLNEPIGVITKMIEDENGLYFEGLLLVDGDPLSKRAYVHMKAGSLTSFSIGYICPDFEYDSEKDAYILKEIDLWEVSLVTFPANEEARVENVKSILGAGDTPAPKQVERVLRDAGFSRQQAKSFIAHGYSGLSQREADNSVELKSMTASMQSILNAIQK